MFCERSFQIGISEQVRESFDSDRNFGAGLQIISPVKCVIEGDTDRGLESTGIFIDGNRGRKENGS